MEDAGLTNAELARLMNVSEAAIWNLLKGRAHTVSGANVFPMADALGVSARWLLTGAPPAQNDHAANPHKGDPQALRLAQRLSLLDERQRKAVSALIDLLIEKK